MFGIAVIAILILAASAASKPAGEAEGPSEAPEAPPSVSEIEGDVYTADVLPLEVVAGQIGDRFYWFLFRASDIADDPKETTAPPIGRGDEATPEKALAAGVDFAENLPPFPAPIGGEGGPGTQAQGVRINEDCTQIGVYDLGMWISHAAPIVRASNSSDADTLMREAFLSVFGGCGIEDGNSPEIRGQTWDKTKTRVQNAVNKIIEGLMLDPAPNEEVIAARIVGMSVPSVPGASAINHIGEKNGNLHTIVIRPVGEDGFFRYWVWQGPRTDYATAMFTGTKPTKTAARNEAKSKADNYLNIGTNLG